MSTVCVCSMVKLWYHSFAFKYTLAVVALMNAGFRCFVVAFRKAGFERGIIYIKSFKNYKVSCT